jgi:hypothetical protein
MRPTGISTPVLIPGEMSRRSILDEGFRPSEVFHFRWEHIVFEGRGFILVLLLD